MSAVVTRFAPSPTGLLHAGNYRTAIFAYLFAKKNGGKFIVRIEDTDQARSKKEYEENILETLAWLDLRHDELYHQSAHRERHKTMLGKLIEQDRAYVAEEGVIRFRNPNVAITFEDAVRGPITFDTTELHDFVLARSMESPVFHFAVVVDDADEGVSHVVRGEDHISNTPRQILIAQALGLPSPVYAHVPLVLAQDRTKLSKRSGAKPLLQYRDEGYLPQAVINYLALLGWHPEGEREIFELAELVDAFDIARIQKGAAMFDETKLKWFNHEHLKKLSQEEYAACVKEFSGKEVDKKLIPLLKERAETLADARAMLGGELDFMGPLSYEPDLLTKGAKADGQTVQKHLDASSKLLQVLAPEDFISQKIKDAVFPYATKEGRGAVLWPLRVALSGKEKSPDPFSLAEVLGKEETLRRIAAARAML